MSAVRALAARLPSASAVRTRAAIACLELARVVAPVNLHGDGVNRETGNRAALVSVAPTAAEAAGLALEVAKRVVASIPDDDELDDDDDEETPW